MRIVGNRSPLADNDMRGMLVGISLDKTVTDLALRYYATGEAIALQTRQIIDEMNAKGHHIKYIFMSGGLVKNEFLMSLIADVCNIPVQLPNSFSASVVLGSAMLGAAAAGESEKGVIETQAQAEKGSFGMKERLWDVMVRSPPPSSSNLTELENSDPNVETWNDDQAFRFSKGTQASRRQVRDLQGVYRVAEEVEEQGCRRFGGID